MEEITAIPYATTLSEKQIADSVLIKILERDQLVQERDQLVQERDQLVQERDQLLLVNLKINDSFSWKITMPVRVVHGLGKLLIKKMALPNIRNLE